jgi:hypothetical protein
MLLRILQVILLLAFVRFILALFRSMAGHRPPDRERRDAPPRPRGRVIDVDYTEEKRRR